jgi:hypothetical protein
MPETGRAERFARVPGGLAHRVASMCVAVLMQPLVQPFARGPAHGALTATATTRPTTPPASRASLRPTDWSQEVSGLFADPLN